MNYFRIWLLLLSLWSIALAQGNCDLLIRNVSVIDVRNGTTLPGRYVYIQGDRISAITSAANPKVTASTTIDGTGKFLMPGLWDMHTHNWWNIHFSADYVSNGVLGVRNMYTPMQFITPLKDSINTGLLDGPYYYAAGRVLEGPEPEFPDWIVVDDVSKIEAALDTLQMEGSDFVKLYNKIPREVYFDLVKAARKRGMSVEGHLPMSVSALEASRAGQRSFEHLLGVPDLCTHDSLFSNKYKYNWFSAVMKEDDYGTLTIDETCALKNFSVLKTNGTYICPTLVVWHVYLHPDTPFEDNPLLERYPKEMRDYWSGAMDMFRKKDAAWKEMALRKYKNLQQVVYLLYKAGVPMLAGTDAINPYCYPGFSLHTELQLLRECGIPNDEVLRMATLNPARFLNLKDQGQVKKGFVASLLLLNQNPLLDISHTRSIAKVILKGKVLEGVSGK